MQVSEYFSSYKIIIDKASVKKVDAEIDRINAKLEGKGKGRGFGLGNFKINQAKLDAALGKALEVASLKATMNINKFEVNQTALNLALGTALDVASARNTFHIARFNVDQSHLNAAMIAAMITATKAASLIPIRPKVAPQNGGQNGAERGLSRRTAVAAGGIAGGLSRVYAPALGLALGGYGLSQLNQRNQQVVSAQLQSQAVVQQAGGSLQEGSNSFQYLRSEGQRIGFNYLDASGDYNKLISGLTGSGVSLRESQKVFSGFAELARVNKLDKTTQNRLFRALSQVAGKGKLQSEELTGQIAEALPGGTALFAQAYQAKIGGNKTGSEAIQQLLADMKKGKVTSDILTYAGAAASQRANEGGALGKASTASQAEQARYQNSVNDLAVVASNSGVEEGFARIFRTLNAGLSESGDLVKTLAEGFNEATEWADDLLLWPQSFIRALEGKDSLVADWLGKEQTAQLITDWTQIKSLWADINSVKAPDWLPSLESTTKELKSLLDAIARLKGTSDQAKGIVQEEYNKDPTVWGNIKGIAKANWFTFTNAVDAVNPVNMDQAKANWDYWLGNKTSPDIEATDLSSMQYDDEGSRRQLALDAAQAASEDSIRARLRDSLNNYNSGGFGLPNSNSVMNTLGLFPTYKPFDFSSSDFLRSPEYQPILLDDGSKSAYQPSNPEEMADWNKSAAMAQAEQAVTNNQSNQFDISITIDGATLMGMDVQAQGQMLGESFVQQITSAFEHVQTQFPTRE